MRQPPRRPALASTRGVARSFSGACSRRADVAPIRTEAVLLRAHDYGDSSRILRLYTSGYGLLSVVARGSAGTQRKGGRDHGELRVR